MYKRQSKALLKKINVLHDSAIDFEGSMTPMERDLLLQYLRDLYETILEEGPTVAAVPSRVRNEPVPVHQPAPQPVMHREEPAPVKRVVSAPPPIIQEVPVAPASLPVQASVTPAVKPEGGKKKERLAALFQSDEAQDLRSKFGSLPISDISKSMGINDKILTINELFGGDQGLFNSIVGELNGFKSFDKAQEYLIGGVAKKQGWYEENKKEKAATFIKLIRRRYI